MKNNLYRFLLMFCILLGSCFLCVTEVKAEVVIIPLGSGGFSGAGIGAGVSSKKGVITFKNANDCSQVCSECTGLISKVKCDSSKLNANAYLGSVNYEGDYDLYKDQFLKYNLKYGDYYIKYDNSTSKNEPIQAEENSCYWSEEFSDSKEWVCTNLQGCQSTCSSAGDCVNRTSGARSFYICTSHPKNNITSTMTEERKEQLDTDVRNNRENGDGVAATLGNAFKVTNGKITCEGALGSAIKLLSKIFGYIKIAAILLFFLFSILDFTKAVANDGELNKAFSKMLKRAVIVILIVILPTIINLILSIIQLNSGLCGI